MSTDTTRVYRRLLRRETHRSRSGAAIVVLALVALVALWLGTEAVLAALGVAPLLLAPATMIEGAAALDAVAPGILIAAGVVAALIGLALLALALAPGRRGRHTVADDRLAVVVDDGVIASALARAARTAARTPGERTRASVSRSSAVIDVTPVSGTAVEKSDVDDAVAAELDRIDAQPRPRSTVRIAASGRI
ncbi:hypothetical protein HQQ81_04115 [Microbacteriaceae bacterium VKM Ac-2854]|nr:hypothetical protein [Microbacteriaceae bacterium VKM Ac-2854]